MTLLTAALGSAARVLDRLSRTLMYAAAATYRLSDMRAGAEPYWRHYATDDDAIDPGWSSWERRIVESLPPGVRRVLVIGCGSGRDLIPFAAAGYEVVGLDPSRTALERCRRKLDEHGLAATLIEGFFEDASVPGRFDVVWFSQLAYSYIIGSEARIRALGKAARLAPGGSIVLSALHSEPPTRAAGLGGAVGRLLRTDWRLEPGDEIFPVPGTRFFHLQHHFGADGVRREIARAGLTIVSTEPSGGAYVVVDVRTEPSRPDEYTAGRHNSASLSPTL